MHSPLWTGTNEAGSLSILEKLTSWCWAGSIGERRQNWYCTIHSVTHLRITLDDQLKWQEHIQKLRGKCFAGLARLKRVCRDLPLDVRKKLYCALIKPHTDYCSVVWDQLTVEREKKVEAIQNAGLRRILRTPRTATGTELRLKLEWTTLAQRRSLMH